MALAPELIGSGVRTPKQAEIFLDLNIIYPQALPEGCVETYGGWIVDIGYGREWEVSDREPYRAKIASFEVTVFSEARLIGSERLSVFNLQGEIVTPTGDSLGRRIHKMGGVETQIILVESLDPPLQNIKSLHARRLGIFSDLLLKNQF